MSTDDTAPMDEEPSDDALASDADEIGTMIDEPSPPLNEPLGITGELEAVSDVTMEGYSPAAPCITGFKPRLADKRGGTPVTILGAGFAPGCNVIVDGEEVIGEVIDAFTLRFVAPARDADKVVVEVEAASGKRSADGQHLDYALGPELLRAIPDEMPLEGGVYVIIEGERFAGGASLNLFGMHAPEINQDGTERISFLAPAAGDGPLDGMVIVTNPNGLAGRSETLLRYRRLMPQLSTVEPARGWVSGGKVINAVGVDFHQRVRATFGGRPATVRYRSRTALELEVPPAEQTGPVEIVLTNPDGAETRLANAFTYEPVPAPPKIIDAIPRTGLTLGGSTVRITGDNFTDDVRVKIGEVTCMRKVISAKLIDAELPPRKLPGQVAIEVSVEGVVVRAEDIFTYESPRAPKVTHLEPRTGPLAGGTRVVIEGEGFPGNATVRFGGETAKTVIVKSSQKIETVTPRSSVAAAVDVEVSSPETGAGISKAGFKYETIPPPVITLVAPAKGTIDGGTELSSEGKNFAEGVVVIIAGVPSKTKRISGSVLEAKTPEGDDGKLVDVEVKNPDGQKAIQKRAFQYDARYRS